eukprot:7977305-Alexandrium_andersonii.AAC.1
MFCSPADSSGSYDCQLWVRHELGFTLKSLKCVSPRLLKVVGTFGGLSTVFHFVVGHAPVEAASDDDKCRFWSGIDRLLSGSASGGDVRYVAFVDANARVGEQLP